MRRVLSLLIAVLAAALPLAAPAGQLNVSPVRFTFEPGQTISTLTLQNVGVDPMRVQVKVYAWAQGPDGSMRLTPSDDVVAFPTLLAIDPAGARQIRVGYTGPAPHIERTFRIFVEELPALGSLQRGLALNLRTRVGIPVFVQPAGARAKARISDVAIRRGSIQLGLTNDGNAAFMANRVAVRALDGSGNAVLERELSGWYVLAGDRREYDFSVPGASCAKIRNVVFDIQTDSGAVRETRAVNSGCG